MVSPRWLSAGRWQPPRPTRSRPTRCRRSSSTSARRSARSRRSGSRRAPPRSTRRPSTRATSASSSPSTTCSGFPFDEEHGGTGTGTLMLNIAVEEIAAACASSALILMVQELGTLPIRLFGTDEQKQRFLPKCASGRVDSRLRALRARRRLRPGRDAHPRRPRRRRVGDRRGEELDLQPRRQRLLRRLLRHRSRRGPLARDLCVHRRVRSGRGLRRQARAQDGDPRLAHRPAGLRLRPRPGREPDRDRERGLQGRDGDARPLPPRRRRAGRRDRPGRDRLRRRLRPGAPAVRQADRRLPGDPVQARRDGDAHGGRARAPLPRLRRRSTPAITTWASTRRWRSCSPPTPRCG